MMHAQILETRLGVTPRIADDERDLVARCVRGERAAQRALVERYKGFVFRVALKVVRDRHQAEDLAQEAFLKILDKLATFKGETSVETWMYRLTLNHSLDYLRRVKGKQSVALEVLGEGPAAPDASPEAAMLEGELAGAVGRALAELPAKFRVVYTLHHWEDLSYEEIARLEKTSVSAIKMRIQRGRALLVAKLKGWMEKHP